MFGGRKTALVLFSLVALCLLLLPIWPAEETASVELRTTEVRNASKLLGENRADTQAIPSGEPVRNPPATDTMTLTVRRLGLRGVAVPTGSSQAQLDSAGVLHMEGTGLPWEEGSNTFIAGHALGFPRTRVPRAFYDLEKLVPGDEISVNDADGRRYTFRVYDRLTVEPDDYWVTYPVKGRTVISLQTCVPIPTFEDRLIVRGELIS